MLDARSELRQVSRQRSSEKSLGRWIGQLEALGRVEDEDALGQCPQNGVELRASLIRRLVQLSVLERDSGPRAELERELQVAL